MKKKQSKIRVSDETKARLCQWWVVGAVCFFIAMGTPVGGYADALDLIFFLGVGIGLANIFIFYPVAYNMFTLRRRGEIINKKYFQRTIPQNVILSLCEIFRCLLTTIVVYFTYQLLNMGLVALLAKPTGTVILAVEPVLFAIFFMIYYSGTNGIVDKIYDMLDKVKETRGKS